MTATASQNPARTPAGPGVDISGAPVVDPTRNVLNLVAAENRRQDDLRAMESAHLREMRELRADCQKDELAALKDVERLRAAHTRELREAEAARIDAIRAVDVGNVQRAAEVQATQANTLASQVALSAEALRTQVAAAASAAQTALSAALEPIIKDIADLRRAQYEAQGVKAQSTETGGISRAWLALGISAAVGMISFAVLAFTVIAAVTHGFK